MNGLDLNERAGQTTGDASTAYVLKFERVKTGERWEVDVLAFRDNTTSPSRIDVYKEGHGYNHYVGQVQPAVKGYVYTLDRKFWVGPGETLVVEFRGGGSADDMEAWITGTQWVKE